MSYTFVVKDAQLTMLFAKDTIFEKNMQKHAHGKQSYEIHYIDSGKGTLICEDKEYSLKKGTLFVTGPFIKHEQLTSKSDPMHEFCLYLKLEKASKNEIVQNFIQTNFWFGQDKQNIVWYICEIIKEEKEKNLGYEEKIKSLLTGIFVLLVRNYNEPPHKKANLLKEKDSIKYLTIEEMFLYQYQDISLQNLANELCLSLRQTERILMKYYGKTFSQMKRDAKMAAGATMLKETELSIEEIAEKLGFHSSSHFCATFKTHFSKTPLNYKKQ